MSIQGEILWLCSQANGKITPIKVDANGDIGATTNTIANNVFDGTISGAILVMGRASNGEIVPLKVNTLGDI